MEPLAVTGNTPHLACMQQFENESEHEAIQQRISGEAPQKLFSIGTTKAVFYWNLFVQNDAVDWTSEGSP